MTSSDLFEEMGGEQTFRGIVGRFYEQVATDEVLRPLYPEEDLGPAEERFSNFLIQYWGGPQTYSDQRGHPRLRMRHGPFRITHAERVAWLRAMRTAIDESDMPEAHQAVLWDYLERAALAMVNTPG